MTGRSRIIGFGLCALLVLLGIAGALAFSGTVGQVLAFVLISLGLVFATALVFLEVGFSEDRERAREGAARAKQEGLKRRPRLRLERRRGQRRRL